MQNPNITTCRVQYLGMGALAKRLGVCNMTLWRVRNGLRDNPAVADALAAAGIPVIPYRRRPKKGGAK